MLLSSFVNTSHEILPKFKRLTYDDALQPKGLHHKTFTGVINDFNLNWLTFDKPV
jgi:hypothetical protein